MTSRFSVQALDCKTGDIHDITVTATTLDSAIEKVESDPDHEFEIIEIERLTP